MEGVFFTSPALKVISMELVPPNKVHREEAKSGDSISILKKNLSLWRLGIQVSFSVPNWHQKLIEWHQFKLGTKN